MKLLLGTDQGVFAWDPSGSPVRLFEAPSVSEGLASLSVPAASAGG